MQFLPNSAPSSQRQQPGPHSQCPGLHRQGQAPVPSAPVPTASAPVPSASAPVPSTSPAGREKGKKALRPLQAAGWGKAEQRNPRTQLPQWVPVPAPAQAGGARKNQQVPALLKHGSWC